MAFSWQFQFRWSYTHANPCPGDKCVMEDDTGDSNQHFQLWSPTVQKQLPGGVCVTYKHKSNLAWGRQGLSQEIPVALCQVPLTYVFEAIQVSLFPAGERQFPSQLSWGPGMFSAIQTGALYSVQVLLQLFFEREVWNPGLRLGFPVVHVELQEECSAGNIIHVHTALNSHKIWRYI